MFFVIKLIIGPTFLPIILIMYWINIFDFVQNIFAESNVYLWIEIS